MTAELHELSIAKAGALMRAGELTSARLTQYALDMIEARDKSLNAFIVLTQEQALLQAQQQDQAFREGVDRGPMQGVPYALKDNFDVVGLETTCNSRVRRETLPEVDSHVQSRLAAQGGVLIGKLNMFELATAWESFDTPFEPARNPWDLDLSTGGSSSGAGAAVAEGFIRVAMGSDTSGSIRWPACWCGAVGMKPTRGLISRRGVFPLSSTLDHCGPIAWTIEDAALALQAVAGYDPGDPASEPVAPPNFTQDLHRGVAGVRIAFARSLYTSTAAPEIVSAMDAAASRFSAFGAHVEEVDLPNHEICAAATRVILAAEAYALHQTALRSRPLDFTEKAYLRIVPGAFVSAADYIQARELQRELEFRLNEGVLSSYDAILTAVVLSLPSRLDDEGSPECLSPKLQAATANLTGNPALAFPIGLSAAGLPIGAQLIGRKFDEGGLFRIGHAYESACGPKRRPHRL